MSCKISSELSEEDMDAKQIKLDTLENILNKFDFVKILNENAQNKLIIIHAVTKNEEVSEDAVVIFEKSHFNLDEIKSYMKTKISFEMYIDNNVYKKLSIYPNKPFNSVQVQLIHPATEAHIKKYTLAESYFLQETYDDWLNVTSEHIKKKSFDLTWVDNILEHKTEVERIVFEDTDKTNGFVLLPDLKWDGVTIENLYLLAIIHQRAIGSLRNLDASHISMLENIREKGFAAIEAKYNVKKSKIRAYLHYYPSFYHLHIHFTHINFQIAGFFERNHMLNSVIENLKLDSDYYRKVSLECVIKRNDPLYELYKSKFENDRE